MADHKDHYLGREDDIVKGVFADEAFEDEPEDRESVEDRLERVVQRAVDQALLWRDEELDSQQEQATNYYMGRPFGTEVEGRSRVVSTDVRDTVQAMLPSLMRIFFGPENTVEYLPRGPEDVEKAEQMTDMASYVIRNDNEGFLEFHGWFKDAMVRKLGVMKVWWEDSERTEGAEYTGLTEQDLLSLQNQEGTEVDVTAQYAGAAPGTPTGMISLYDASVTRSHSDGRIKFAVIPSEEFLFSPDARGRNTAEMMGHVRNVPASELIAMGVDPELVEEHKGSAKHKRTGGDDLEQARRFDEDDREALEDERDEARDSCWYGEVYIYADVSEEENGEADLIRVEVIGENHELIDWYICEQRPFALLTCDPEPHTLIGQSVADYVMDVQLIKSSVLRGMLDSFTLSVNPRTVVLDGEVDMNDVLNHEIGGVIRVDRDVNDIKEFVHRFDESGAAAFPVLQYMDEQKENRTGMSKAAMGLDADALQSSTKMAVAGTLSAAQQHIEMLARVFAETGVRQLYSLILQLMVQHQDQARTVRLRGEWVEMDPTDWDGTMDVSIALALGAGGSAEKVQLLQAILGNQEIQLREGSPLVSFLEYRNTLARATKLAGFTNPDEFYRPWTEEDQAKHDEAQEQKQPEDPNMVLAQGTLEIERARLEMDREEMMMKDARERAKMELDNALKQATAEAQYGAKIDNQEMQADMQAAKGVIDAAAKEAVARIQASAPPQGGPINGPTGPATQ